MNAFSVAQVFPFIYILYSWSFGIYLRVCFWALLLLLLVLLLHHFLFSNEKKNQFSYLLILLSNSAPKLYAIRARAWVCECSFFFFKRCMNTEQTQTLSILELGCIVFSPQNNVYFLIFDTTLFKGIFFFHFFLSIFGHSAWLLEFLSDLLCTVNSFHFIYIVFTILCCQHFIGFLIWPSFHLLVFYVTRLWGDCNRMQNLIKIS